MATTKRKPRGKIPYIGRPATASEIAADYPPLPRKYQEYLDRTLPEFLEKIRQRESKRQRSSGKTARAK